MCFLFNFSVINVWTIEKNKNKTKSRRNSQQISGEKDTNTNTNENIIQATNQKFGTNGKITVKQTGLGHEGKYTPKYVFGFINLIFFNSEKKNNFCLELTKSFHLALSSLVAYPLLASASSVLKI